MRIKISLKKHTGDTTKLKIKIPKEKFVQISKTITTTGSTNTNNSYDVRQGFMNDEQASFLHNPSIGLQNEKTPNKMDLDKAAEETINQFQSEYQKQEHHSYSLKDKKKPTLHILQMDWETAATPMETSRNQFCESI